MSGLKDMRHTFNRIVFSNKFYNAFLNPFAKVLFEFVPTCQLKEERRECLPLNKTCHVADIYNPEWKQTFSEIKLDINEHNFHRKDWEHTQIIYSLKKLNLLTPRSTGLAVGAGRESLLYYLTYKVKKIFGMDLYEGFYYGGEDEKDIPLAAEKYAPFPYMPEKLHLRHMDALKLGFSDSTFDFIFSASSIEHFGTKKSIAKSLLEMYRVLKPGGAVFITTELKLTSLGTRLPRVKPFFLKELLVLAQEAGFKTPGDFDLRIEKEYFTNWVKLPEEIHKRPHVILRFFNTVFTSIHIVLEKEGHMAIRGDETFSEIPDFQYHSQIKVALAKESVATGGDVQLDITLFNRCNFKWIHTGFSHRIALGIQLLSLQKSVVDRDYGTVLLPCEVKPGETLRFSASLKAPREQGTWFLRFAMKKELVLWFPEKGDSVSDVKIRCVGNSRSLSL